MNADRSRDPAPQDTPHFSPEISARLRDFATPDEIATLHHVLDEAGRLRCPWWYLSFVVRIIEKIRTPYP